ncbi:ABC transporter substrate-binding protein [Ensifer sp. YR511]|uniref:ABC transporter substrate-binding protein n=1 Tax=Ensifer sp. YR511 TaxID=1855294 RepID=UPI00088998F4|nr:ABC transporter substrate-binding protein [Ensifer sp. YR511]SDN76114.1 ABC-type nitrate/sulfonate/bicarbonate transport system, substrate-binding protein [Ensifer sp. YR511]
MPDKLRITESSPAAKFAPQYVAESLGYFRDEDLDVTFGVDAGPAGSWLADNLVADKADIALGGIWLPFAYRDLGIADLVPFAAVCHRNPAMLVSRTPIHGPFDWAILEGKRLVLALAATSQWMFLEGVLQERGVDLGRVQVVRDLHIETMQRLWKEGLGDFFLAEPTTALALIDAGYVLAATMADAAGPVPWSVYYARRGSVFANSPMHRFQRAIARAVDWILDGHASDTAAIVAERLKQSNTTVMQRTVQHLIASGTWQRNLNICADATDRYAAMMVRYGLLRVMPDAASVGFNAPSAICRT